MPDIATISAILGSVKTATDIAKLIKDSGSSLEQAEMKLKLADLISTLADTKMEAVALQQLLLEKDDVIRKLNDLINTRASLVWENTVYWHLNNEVKEGPFCPQCFDCDSKQIRLQEHEREHWQCMTCKNSFFGEGHSSGGDSFEPDSY